MNSDYTVENQNDIPMSSVKNSSEKLCVLDRPAAAQKLVSADRIRICGSSFLQFILVYSGNGLGMINGKEFQIVPGLFSIMESGTKLEFLPSSPVVLYSCSFRPELFGYGGEPPCSLRSIAGDPVLQPFFELSCDWSLIRLPHAKLGDFQVMFHDMISESGSRSRIHWQIMRLKISEMLLRLSETVSTDVGDGMINNTKLVHQITAYIREHYREKITYDQLARIAYVSRSKLSYLFKEIVGQTIGDYIEAVRMEQACRMLLETQNTVVNIMLDVGYKDMKLFGKRFREYAGMTPSEYRKQHKSVSPPKKEKIFLTGH